jgi:RNA polymerase-binding transcription factor DksA
VDHEDGYCDVCGAEVDTPQLTVDGLAVCEDCVAAQSRVTAKGPLRPEARDDGR